MPSSNNSQRFDLLGVITTLLLVIAFALLVFVLVPQMASKDLTADGSPDVSKAPAPNPPQGITTSRAGRAGSG